MQWILVALEKLNNNTAKREISFSQILIPMFLRELFHWKMKSLLNFAMQCNDNDLTIESNNQWTFKYYFLINSQPPLLML